MKGFGRPPPLSSPTKSVSMVTTSKKSSIVRPGSADSGTSGASGSSLKSPNALRASAPAPLPTVPKMLEILPNPIELENIEAGKTYVVTVTVRNISQENRRVRVVGGAIPDFKVHFQPTVGLAPGLAQSFEIEFTPPEDRDYHDYVRISTEDEHLEIPVHAYTPRPDLRLEGSASFGTVVPNAHAERYLELRNEGRRRGKYVFLYDESLPVRVTPKRGILEGKASGSKNVERIKVEFFGTDLGPFRSMVQAELEGYPILKAVDVSATVIQSRVELVFPNGGGLVSNVSFGSLYAGQSRVIPALLVNNSPAMCSFALSHATEGGDSDSAVDTPSPPPIQVISASPAEGQLKPYGQVEVLFKFAPPPNRGRKQGFKSTEKRTEQEIETFNANMVVDVVETEQKIEFALTGKAYRPWVTVSESQFRFGECAVHDRNDLMFTVKNECDELAIQYEVEKVSQFVARPARGKLLPLQSQTVVLSFCPNQLGTFQHVIQLSVCGDVFSIPLHVSGFAEKSGEKKKLIGGPNALPQDFKPKFNFIDPSTVVFTRPQSAVNYKRKNPWEGMEARSEENPEEFLDKIDVLKSKAEHHSVYNTYLKTKREEREAKIRLELVKPYDPSDPDLGLDPRDRLRSPLLPLPPTDQALWLEDGAINLNGDQQSTTVRPRKQHKFDENRLIKKKFKSAPTAPNETRECKIELTPKELLNVATGPKVLDFGKVNVHSTNVKSFCVSNDLKQFIQVKLILDRDEIKYCTPASQVIPAGATAGFDITFRSGVVQNFQQPLYFTINDTHKLKFVVFAEVVPIDLQLSAEELSFRFTEFNLEAHVTEIITLTNTGNSKAVFSTNVDTPFFTLSPAQGEIEPFKTMSINITYRPTNAPLTRVESSVVFHVDGGYDKRLRCIGVVNEAKCVCVEKKIDFGIVPVGILKHKTFTLKNVGENNAMFFIENPMPSITVNPMRGRVSVGQSQDVTVTLRPGASQIYESNLSVHIRGGKSIKLPVKCEAKIPMLEIPDSTFEFGEVFVGSSASRAVTVRNISNIPAVVYVDLTQHMDFTITFADGTEVKERNASEEEPHIVLVPSSENTESQEPSANWNNNMSPINPPEEEDEDDSFDDEESRPEEGFKYKLTIPPQSTFAFNLVFSPQTVEVHEFTLPLSMVGMPASNAQSLARGVTAEGVKPRLVFSQMITDFGNRVMIKDGTSMMPSRIQMSLTNEDDKVIPWFLDMSAAESLSRIFSIIPSSGSLLPGQTETVEVLFTPREATSYRLVLPVIIDGDHPYTTVELRGNGIHPMLTFDRKEIVLPVVPLDVTASAAFQILNDGYENLEIRYRLPVDTTRIPVAINFPEGKIIGRGKSSLPVEVSFVSRKPISFTIKIEFLDNEGNRFAIPLTGTVDNCLLTAYPFVMSTKDEYEIKGTDPKKPILMVPKPDVEDPDAAGIDDQDLIPSARLSIYGESDAASSVYAKSDRLLRRAFGQRSVERLKNWLNMNVLAEPVENLVEGFTASNGALLYEIVEYLLGKQLHGRVEKFSTNRKDATKQLLGQYETALSHLREYGALLNSVRAEYMLKFEDFQRIQALAPNGSAGSPGFSPPGSSNGGLSTPITSRRMSEKRYMMRATEAWLCTIYQIIKVFTLSRITAKNFKILPGIGKEVAATPDPTLSQSNIYSVGECVILKWLTYHYARMSTRLGRSASNGATIRVTNFDNDLRSSHVLAAVLQSHIPSTASKFEGLRATCKEVGDFEHNASILIAAMREAGLEYSLSVRDVVEAVARDMLLVCMYLYQTLPQYVPKATIEFQGKILERVVKTIELSNPTTKPIEYAVLLTGSDAFKIADEKVKVEARSQTVFAIEVVSRFTSTAEARLSFLSRRIGASQASTMVFLLKSSVISGHAQKTIDVEVPVYEMRQIEVEVENPFPANARFSVTMNQDRPRDQDSSSTPEPFYLTTDNLPIKKGEKTTISIQFLPFQIGDYKCRMTFMDPNAGEFVYHINGKAVAPLPVEKISMSCEAKTTTTKDCVIASRNLLLEKAAAAVQERYKALKLKRTVSPFPSGDEPILYKIEYGSPFFSGPSEILIPRPVAKEGNANNNANKKVGQDTFTPISFNFMPKGAGVYPCKIVLRSPYDVRIYEVEGKARSPGTRVELDFSAPVRQTIVQDIPLANKSTTEWVISAILAGEGFSGPKDLKVHPGKTVIYPLSFRPTQPGEFSAQLTLENQVTLEKSVYVLKGVAEDPLAEDHIVVECQARSMAQVRLRVRMLGEIGDYHVESDLPFIAGDDKVHVTKDDTEYTLGLMPPRGGTYQGTVTFTAGNGQYCWYTLEVRAARPQHEGVVEIESVLREAVIAQISITNPLDKDVDLDVSLAGDGLIGEPVLQLGPNETSTYELVYAPLRRGASEGSIAFSSDEIGEFWYLLKLNACAPDPIVLPDMQCEIGKMVSQYFELENPTTDDVPLRVFNTNSRNYTLRPTAATLPPAGKLHMLVEYCPSSINQVEAAEITFENPRVGEWTFLIKGTGRVPTVMDTTNVVCALGKVATGIITFKNPLTTSKRVAVRLTTEELPDVFGLLLKRPTVLVPPMGTLQIPISFTPVSMRDHPALVIVEMVGEDGTAPTPNELKWRFPISGVAEAATSDRTFHIGCRARTRHEERIEITAEDLGDPSPDDKFSFDFDIPKEFQTTLRRALTVHQVTPSLVNGVLAFDLTFVPLKPFITTSEFVVRKLSGGLWRFETTFDVAPADIDDCIMIEAGINKTESVSFRLSNIFAAASAFTAKFTPDSPADFSVSPAKGMLAPFGSDGTQFIVSYTANNYGKTLIGTLVIETDEMQWRYEVKGMLPHYVKPTVGSRVDTRLSVSVAAAERSPKNFVKENLRRSSVSPVKRPATLLSPTKR